jgi:chemotaxis protein MotB
MIMRGDQGDRLSMPEARNGGEADAWLMSYLDVLTLLITLFVLLVSMLGKSSSHTPEELMDSGRRPGQQSMQGGAIASGAESGGTGRQDQAGAITGSSAAGLQPSAAGLKPQRDGLRPEGQGLWGRDRERQSTEQPSFQGLAGVDGVSIAEGQEGITLRIDDNLLFASGDANLTAGGKKVIESLVPTLQSFDGQISVEGHTDNVPISTARFPSNWELSTSRAIAVLRHLIQTGIPEGRLRAIGYADTQPLNANDSAAGRAVNRRVELLLKQRI